MPQLCRHGTVAARSPSPLIGSEVGSPTPLLALHLLSPILSPLAASRLLLSSLLISRCLFTPPSRSVSAPSLSVPSVSAIFFHLRLVPLCLCYTCDRRFFVRSCKRTGQQDLASRTDARLGHREYELGFIILASTRRYSRYIFTHRSFIHHRL